MKKFFTGIAVFTTTAVLYLSSNHFHIFPPRPLPISRIDAAIPFVPQTVWIYVSEYIYFAAVYWRYRDAMNLKKFVYSFLSLQALSTLVFWLWPTAFPRDLFPLPKDLDPWTCLLLTALRRVDSPANCFPSLHVGSVYLMSFLLLNEPLRIKACTRDQNYQRPGISRFCDEGM